MGQRWGAAVGLKHSRAGHRCCASFDNDAPLPERAFTDACGVLLRVGSSNNTIRRNELFGSAFGIFVPGGSDGNVVSGNDSHDNRRFGIINRGNAAR